MSFAPRPSFGRWRTWMWPRRCPLSRSRPTSSTLVRRRGITRTAITTPPPGNGQPPQVTTTFYYVTGQATNVVYPDATSVTNVLTLRGEIVQTRGSRTYPTGYGYDDQGRLQFMTNWSTFPNVSGTRV